MTRLDKFYVFLRVLAGRTGQILNTLSIAEECGISHNTINEWISILEASFLVFKLRPYHKNYNKRLIKSPKIYFTDPGLVCSLLGIRKKEDLDYHYLKGNIFETFVVSEFLKESHNTGESYRLFYWRDNHKKEIDLILDFGVRACGVEIKSGKTIHERFFDGLRYWRDLTGCNSESLSLVYGGDQSMVRNKMNVVGWNQIYEQIVEPIVG